MHNKEHPKTHASLMGKNTLILHPIITWAWHLIQRLYPQAVMQSEHTARLFLQVGSSLGKK